MYMHKYSQLLDTSNTEVIKQEVITYVKRDGKIEKITVKRDFYLDDYVDSMTSEPLYVLK